MSEKDAPNQNESDHSDPVQGKASAQSGDAAAEHSESGSRSPGAGQDPSRSEANSRSAGRGLSLFALLLAVLALGGVGWLSYQNLVVADPSTDRSVAAISALQSDLDSLRERLTSVDAARDQIERELSDSNQREAERLASIERAQAELQQRLDESDADQINDQQLQATLSRQAEAVQSLQDGLGEIESDLSNLTASQASVDSRLDGVMETMREAQGVQREVDRDLALKLDLLEIASLIAIGQARIELVGDKNEALATYRQANRQLTAISDRRLNQAAEQMAEEIALIESLDEPDWTRFTALLAQWEGQVSSWPLRPEMGGSNAPNASAADEGVDEASGWLSTVRQSLGQLVTVERRDGLGLDADGVIAIQEQLALHLAAASLAVQRRDLDVLTMRLDHVVAILDNFFQVDSEPLRSIRGELESISGIEAPMAPDGLGRAAAALDRVIEAL